MAAELALELVSFPSSSRAAVVVLGSLDTTHMSSEFCFRPSSLHGLESSRKLRPLYNSFTRRGSSHFVSLAAWRAQFTNFEGLGNGEGGEVERVGCAFVLEDEDVRVEVQIRVYTVLWESVAVVAAMAGGRLGVIMVGMMIVGILVTLWTAIGVEVSEVILSDLGRAAASVGSEGRVAAGRPPAGHRKEEDGERSEDGKEDGWR